MPSWRGRFCYPCGFFLRDESSPTDKNRPVCIQWPLPYARLHKQFSLF